MNIYINESYFCILKPQFMIKKVNFIDSACETSVKFEQGRIGRTEYSTLEKKIFVK